MPTKPETENDQLIKATLVEGVKFNKRIDELVKELVDKAEYIKLELRENAKSEKSLMAHEIDEYLECIPPINRDLLNHLMDKDIQKW